MHIKFKNATIASAEFEKNKGSFPKLLSKLLAIQGQIQIENGEDLTVKQLLKSNFLN